MAARCATEAFSTICAVHIEDCEGWWSSSCHGSAAESTGDSSQRCPGFNSCQLLVFSLSSIFSLKLLNSFINSRSRQMYYSSSLVPRPQFFRKGSGHETSSFHGLLENPLHLCIHLFTGGCSLPALGRWSLPSFHRGCWTSALK